MSWSCCVVDSRLLGMGLLSIALLGLAVLSPVEACFPSGGGGTSTTNTGTTGGATGLDPQPAQEACQDLILYQRFGRGSVERYQFEYSATIGDNLHPPGSTVTIRCREGTGTNAAEATVYAYDSTSTFITSGRAVTALCDPVTRNWLQNSRDFNQVYCSQTPPQAQGR